MSGRRAKGKRQGHPARIAQRESGSGQKAHLTQRPRPRPPVGRPPTRAPRRRWVADLQTLVATRFTSFLKGRTVGERRTALPLTELSRIDLVWAAATGLASAVLFATALTGHPGLGDAPETVAGVSSLGILHAPGYPAYVLAARAFTLLIPLGDEAFRVNLFSLVCASLTIAGVQLLARRCGAVRWAGSLGALVLAVSGGFWFYATFAKADMFSGLLLLITFHLALSWRAGPTTRRLVALAAGLGLGLGSSWPLMVLIGPTIAFVLLVGRRRVTIRGLVAATATGVVIVVGVYGFVMVRAAQDPPLNWGGATTVSRLIDLVGRTDFRPHGNSSAGASAGGGSARSSGLGAQGSGLSAVPPAGTVTTGASLAPDVAGYGIIFGRELGILGLLLAAFGLIASLRRRYTEASYPLVIAFVGNLIGAAVVVGVGSAPGSAADLVEEGFLLGCYFVLACWMAIGATELVAIVSSTRLAGRFERSAHRRRVAPAAAMLLGAAVLVPLVPQDWSVAHREGKPFADRYASTIFAALPRRAALFVWGAELTQPLIYQQVVDHRRRDVIVIAADGLSFSWYREQLSRRLGRPLPSREGNGVIDAARVIRSLEGVRPVYLDPQATEVLKGSVVDRPVGLLAQAGTGSAAGSAPTPTEVEQNVLSAERVAGYPDAAWDKWPNDYATTASFATAALRSARLYYEHHDLVGMRSALINVLSIEPSNSAATSDLATLNGVAPPG